MEQKECVLMNKYEMGKLLGQGTFAKVYHARNLKTGMSVAIKVVDKDKVVRVGMIDHIKREISVMRLIKHPNVVQLYEVMATRSKIYFVMEYVRGGELFEKIKKGRLEEGEARKYFQQLISAVGFCHSRGVYHRDLKPENLLLDDNGDLKVSDFGLSALHETKRQDGLLHTMCGTPAYVAPEVIDRKGYDGCKADIWSCGVVLFVLLAGYLPFNDINLMDMYRKISKAEFKYPKGFSSEKRRLVSKILDPNPETRISIAKIKQNSWFKKGIGSEPRRDDESEGRETEDALLAPSDDNETMVPKQIVGKIGNLNAFDIISFSAGFNLSGLFEEDDEEQMKEVRFMSNQPAKTIIGKLEEVAKRLRLKVAKKEGGFLRMEGSKEGRKGVLAIDAEIFEVTPDFHLVEVKRSGGDTLEYQKIMKQGMKPGLKDIVWDCQGDRKQEQLELP